MLPPKFYKHFGTRIKLTKFALGTYYLWNPEKEQLVLAPPYLIFGMYAAFCGGVGLIFIHGVQIYLKTHPNDISEEGFSENGDEISLSLKDFATLIIEGGQVILIVCCTFLNYVFLQRLNTFMHLFNELLNYNKRMTGLIETGQLTLTPKQRQVARSTTVLLYAVIVMSTLLPVGIMVALSNEVEPHNQIFREWLEIPVKLTWNLLPLLAMMFSALYGVGTTVGLMCMSICLYFTTTTICTESIIPTQMIKKPTVGPGRSEMETGGLGRMSDLDVIQLYRTQQMFNVLLSSFFRSVLISFHHIGLLGAIVALLVFAIKYDSILTENGPMAYVILFSCMTAVVMVIYFQCKMGGAVVDISSRFKLSGSKIFPRKTLFRKFARSCTTFYIEVTYPFYNIHKETFTMFIEQVLDYSIELLLW